MLTTDDRTLTMLNPDRLMLHSFNLASFIESVDVEEKDLGLTLSLYLLHHDPSTILSDFFKDN